MKNERPAEIQVLASVLFFSLFPIFASGTSKMLPPIFFAGISTLLAAVALIPYMLLSSQNVIGGFRREWKTVALVTLLNVVIPFMLIFAGAARTSAINTTLLLKAEIIFTLIFSHFLFGERLTPLKVIGGALSFVGAAVILYRGSLGVNPGDLMIIGGVLFYPFGNYYMKALLGRMSATMLLFLRSLIGGVTLLAASALLETFGADFQHQLVANWHIIAINGLVVLGIAKIFWFKGFKHLELSKAIGMLTAEPAVSLLYAYLLLHEVPSQIQWLGVGITMSALYFLTKGKSIKDPAENIHS